MEETTILAVALDMDGLLLNTEDLYEEVMGDADSAGAAHALGI